MCVERERCVCVKRERCVCAFFHILLSLVSHRKIGFDTSKQKVVNSNNKRSQPLTLRELLKLHNTQEQLIITYNTKIPYIVEVLFLLYAFLFSRNEKILAAHRAKIKSREI